MNPTPATTAANLETFKASLQKILANHPAIGEKIDLAALFPPQIDEVGLANRLKETFDKIAGTLTLWLCSDEGKTDGERTRVKTIMKDWLDILQNFCDVIDDETDKYRSEAQEIIVDLKEDVQRFHDSIPTEDAA